MCNGVLYPPYPHGYTQMSHIFYKNIVLKNKAFLM